MVKRYLDQGKDAGELRKDVDTEAVIEMIFAGMLGASAIYGLDKNSQCIDRCFNGLIGYLETLAT